MKKEDTVFYRLMIRWGIMTVLLLMLGGIGVLLQVITISNKTETELFRGERENEYTAYVTRTDLLDPGCGDTLRVDIPGQEAPVFRIVSVRKEPSFFVLTLHGVSEAEMLHRTFGGNTKVSGYLFTRKVKLWSLVFNRWGIKL